MNETKIGDIVEAYCSRCKLNLDTSVSALANGTVIKVTCRTCNNELKYRAPVDVAAQQQKALKRLMRQREKKFEAPPPSAPTSNTSLREVWDEMTSKVDPRFARVYDSEKEYDLEEALLHKQHGMGVIHDIHGDGTLNVLFRKGFFELPSATGNTDDDAE